jgi:TRAP-type C4-dicarboxylate transport system substrate-binding protein
MFKKAAMVFAAVLAFGLCALTQTRAQTVLRLQCAYPEKANTGQSALFFANEVARLTNNQVQVKVFWPDQAAVKISEAYDAVCQGTLDGYCGSLLYFAGKVPEVNCQWLPYNWANAADAKDVLLNKGYGPIMAGVIARHGATYLGALSVCSMGLMTQFPVTQIGDLKDKKIRAVGIEAEIIRALGALAIDFPPHDQYKALQGGMIDGTDYPWYTIEQYKLYEVLKYVVKPALHTPGIIEVMISTKSLKALTPDQQQAVQKAAMSAMNRSFEESDKIDQEALNKAEKLGVQVSTIPEHRLVKFRGALRPLWNAEAKKSPDSAKLVDILREHLKKSMGIEQ